MRKTQLYYFILLIGGIVMLGFISNTPMQKRNLKVLPANISDERLDSLMETYAKGLGVTCNFCHVKKEDGAFDYAADDNPAKEIARRMMRLTIDINQKYFNYDTTLHPAYLTIVSCNTCHKGNPFPQ